MHCFRTIAIASTLLLTLACGGEARDSEPGTDDAEAELRTSGVTSIYVSRGPGFRPPPPAGSCHPSGHWTVDFEAATITGDACIDGAPVDVARDLGNYDLRRIRAKVSALRAVRKPTSCPTDLPVNAIEIRREDSSSFYVDQRAACGGGTLAVRESGLARLVELLEELSEPPPSPSPAPTCPPCEVGFNCNEQTFTCDPL
jgi:hypothetical protein